MTRWFLLAALTVGVSLLLDLIDVDAAPLFAGLLVAALLAIFGYAPRPRTPADTSTHTNPGNTGKRSEFLGGNIYWSTATDAHPVAHDFLTKWGEKGYEAGFMKYPTTDEVVLSDGRRQEFQGASIYWSALTGAHNVQGLIRDKWRDIGAESGDFKYPTTDETTTPDGIGRYNSFQGGAVYWSPSTGAQPVTGAIYALWAADNWEAGKWGYPVAAQYTEGSSIKQQFQGGVITIGGENPVKDTINGCTMNQEWPHQSHHQPDTVDAPGPGARIGDRVSHAA
ncbi:LGFP repeat-containing protein [Gordonia sputi]